MGDVQGPKKCAYLPPGNESGRKKTKAPSQSTTNCDTTNHTHTHHGKKLKPLLLVDEAVVVVAVFGAIDISVFEF